MTMYLRLILLSTIVLLTGMMSVLLLDRAHKGLQIPFKLDEELLVSDVEKSVDLSKVLKILKTTMNEVGRIESGSPYEIEALRQHVHDGGGALCGGMSLLFSENLAAAGIESRIVSFRRDLEMLGDTHVSVEVPYEGGWIIADPTFHVLFEQDGELLGANDIRSAVEKGLEVSPRFLGEVNYPARLESYYMDFRPLMDHVFINENSPAILQLPPLTYFFAGTKSYFTNNPELKKLYDSSNRELFLLSFVLPMIIASLFIFWIWFEIRLRRGKKITDS